MTAEQKGVKRGGKVNERYAGEEGKHRVEGRSLSYIVLGWDGLVTP